MRLTDTELELLFHEVPAHLRELNSLREQFDRDLDGQLDEKELRRLLRKLGREASRSEIREIIAEADLNAVRANVRLRCVTSPIAGQAPRLYGVSAPDEFCKLSPPTRGAR